MNLVDLKEARIINIPMIKLSILGSTGSVGTQALHVVRAYRQDIELVGLVARRASDKLLNQAREFKPKYVVSYQEPEKDWLESSPCSIGPRDTLKAPPLGYRMGLQDCLERTQLPQAKKVLKGSSSWHHLLS